MNLATIPDHVWYLMAQKAQILELALRGFADQSDVRQHLETQDEAAAPYLHATHT
ncbi:Uncharacterised protein [BD1-7 clade bacterium]|uniref:Uncharacterized protein n=1 Tax=BD1-7 clade bacterium TaxID=2029982 RepID=A0A5S9QFW0_9GAMM|nr:Uncharacterised protein [BD1-7 clade bacterium]